MSWFELYVKFSELLFWIQDGTASAPAAGAATGVTPNAAADAAVVHVLRGQLSLTSIHRLNKQR